MGCCGGNEPLMGQLADYTGGHHTAQENLDHQQMIATCQDVDDNADAADPIILHPANDDVTIEASGNNAWHALNVMVRDQTPAQDVNTPGANLTGNGVRLTSGFSIEGANQTVTNRRMDHTGQNVLMAESRKTLNGGAAVRRQAPASIEDAIRNNANLAVMIVDMAGAGLYERYTGTFVFEYQREILALAVAQGRRILEVIMYRPNQSLVPTHSLLTSAFHGHNALEVFKKPGAGGAASRACVRCDPVTRDGATHRITLAPPALVGQTAVQYLLHHNITDIVVMGYNAHQCVGATIFGRLTSSLGPVPTVNANQPPPGVHDWEYEKGLLDYGFNIITSRKLLGSGREPLVTGYTT